MYILIKKNGQKYLIISVSLAFIIMCTGYLIVNAIPYRVILKNSDGELLPQIPITYFYLNNDRKIIDITYTNKNGTANLKSKPQQILINPEKFEYQPIIDRFPHEIFFKKYRYTLQKGVTGNIKGVILNYSDKPLILIYKMKSLTENEKHTFRINSNKSFDSEVRDIHYRAILITPSKKGNFVVSGVLIGTWQILGYNCSINVSPNKTTFITIPVGSKNSSVSNSD
jgi:hypothetical protein